MLRDRAKVMELGLWPLMRVLALPSEKVAAKHAGIPAHTGTGTVQCYEVVVDNAELSFG